LEVMGLTVPPQIKRRVLKAPAVPATPAAVPVPKIKKAPGKPATPPAVSSAKAKWLARVSETTAETDPVKPSKVTFAAPRKKNSGMREGHWIQKLTEPIEARRLTVGTRIHYGGGYCEVRRVAKAPKGIDLLVITVTKHETRGDFTTCAKPTDLFYRKMVEERKEE
jgi:hypothetical protein